MPFEPRRSPDAGGPQQSDIRTPSGAIPEDAGDAVNCDTVVIDDEFIAIDPDRWLALSAGNETYPRASGNEVTLISDSRSARGSLWLRGGTPLSDFDVSFTFQITCSSSCGDGLAAIWVDKSDFDSLNRAKAGGALGVPQGARGAAAAIDLYPNVDAADGPTPNLAILSLDPKQDPSHYDWHVATSPAQPSFLARHVMTLRLRGNKLTASVDGVTSLQATVPTIAVGAFGLSASTGNATAVYRIASFHGKFYRCGAPQ